MKEIDLIRIMLVSKRAGLKALDKLGYRIGACIADEIIKTVLEAEIHALEQLLSGGANESL